MRALSAYRTIRHLRSTLRPGDFPPTRPRQCFATRQIALSQTPSGWVTTSSRTSISTLRGNLVAVLIFELDELRHSVVLPTSPGRIVVLRQHVVDPSGYPRPTQFMIRIAWRTVMLRVMITSFAAIAAGLFAS